MYYILFIYYSRYNADDIQSRMLYKKLVQVSCTKLLHQIFLIKVRALHYRARKTQAWEMTTP